jgi:transmembrane sensor
MTDPSKTTATRDAASAWFVALRAPGATAEDHHAFEAWKDQSPAHGQAHDRLTALWESDLLAEAAKAAAPAFLPLARVGRPAPRPAPHWRALGRMAAVLVLLIGATLAALPTGFLDSRLRAALADHATPPGERRTLALADGGAITLNGNTALTLDDTPQGARVSLPLGEAFFQVAPQGPGRTFEIRTGQAVITVVGTAFSVSTDGGRTRVAVREGTVKTRSLDGGPVVPVTAGEGVETRRNGPPLPLAIDADSFAWLDGLLAFHDRPLGEVLDTLDRQFPGVVLVARGALKDIRVSGVYRLDDPRAAIMALARVVKAQVSTVSSLVVILR